VFADVFMPNISFGNWSSYFPSYTMPNFSTPSLLFSSGGLSNTFTPQLFNFAPYTFDFSSFLPPIMPSITPTVTQPATQAEAPERVQFRVPYRTDASIPGYNSQKAQELVQSVAGATKPSSTGWCARYVSNALERTRLSNGLRGDAYQMTDILRQNRNFKEIEVAGSDLRSLPAGCIIVYPRGDAGYPRQYGHVEVTLGNGKAVSDFENDIRPSNKDRVFIPV
jgi:hypothetical protein